MSGQITSVCDLVIVALKAILTAVCTIGVMLMRLCVFSQPNTFLIHVDPVASHEAIEIKTERAADGSKCQYCRMRRYTDVSRGRERGMPHQSFILVQRMAVAYARDHEP